MKVILFGGSGMVGQGVLRECLIDPRIEKVLVVGRSPVGQQSEKLEQYVASDLFHLDEARLKGFDACFFCLGVSSAGMSEADYRRTTYDLTMAVAEPLARQNPQMTFTYVSGTSTDSTEKGSSMWARVKGATENALQKLPFKAVYLFRPGFIQPMHGIKSRTRLYRAAYLIAAPLYPLLNFLMPKSLTTTEEVGRAMIRVAAETPEKKYLENEDIRRLGS
jgi:uncharacterized protein YbjT (DUF2867 family)